MLSPLQAVSPEVSESRQATPRNPSYKTYDTQQTTQAIDRPQASNGSQKVLSETNDRMKHQPLVSRPSSKSTSVSVISDNILVMVGIISVVHATTFHP